MVLKNIWIFLIHLLINNDTGMSYCLNVIKDDYLLDNNDDNNNDGVNNGTDEH